jgi:hypothetical protein
MLRCLSECSAVEHGQRDAGLTRYFFAIMAVRMTRKMPKKKRGTSYAILNTKAENKMKFLAG